MEQENKIGVYETNYGNACVVTEESYETNTAQDLDMIMTIPLEWVDFGKLISKDIEDYLY